MDCPSCGSANPEGKKFCGDCGAPLPVRCAACGAENPPGKRFCGDCGAAQPGSARGDASASSMPPVAEPSALPRVPSPSAERRQLTVMFCDLVGSTALASRLDPEDLREVIGAYQRCVAETIQHFDGFVAKHMGDGVLMYFGYPQAHEDDAERAVRAALALVDAVGRLQAPERLRVRIGIGTGLVVVGDLIASGEGQERGVVGETPNLAARLQAIAEADGVVIGPRTRRLVGDLFEVRDLGTVAVKGFIKPVHAYQVLRQSAVESRFEALHEAAALTPLVGRDEEIELLLRRWQRAKCGEGQVVLLSGEPGIGKSRLAVALQERLYEEPHTRVRYFCSPHHQDTALYPTITQLERAAGLRRDDTDEQRLDKLEALLAQATSEPSEATPLLAALLSIPTRNRYPPLNLTPQKRKEKTLKALVAQVAGLAARQPVLLLVEDAQWIDPTSLELLELTVDRVPSLSVMLIITFRPEFMPPWIGRSHVTLLSLTRLPPRQRAEMIARVTEGKALPKMVADQIIERTDGIPLFIEELTKAVVESGELADAGDRYTVARSLAPLAIPTTLQASLLARLDRLAPVREVAQIGAALGRHFSHELISAVAPMPQKQLNGALAQLVRAELVFRRGTPPDAEYTFKHALVQDAAYSTLLRARRQQLHRRIAEALESHFPEIVATEPALLAQHCAEAGLIEKAVGYWLKAGLRALARSAMAEALTQLQKGLQLLASLPDDGCRQQRELDLQIAIGRALIATRGYGAPAIGEIYARARQLCDRLGAPPQLVSVMYGQWAHHLIRDELDLAHHHAREMRDMAEVQDDIPLKVMSCRLMGITGLYRGEFLAARAHLERGLSLYDPADLGRYTALAIDDVHPLLMVYLFRALTCLGYLDSARQCRDAALVEVRQRSHAYALAQALCLTWWGDWGVCSEHNLLCRAEELLAVSTEHGFPLWLAAGTMFRGWCLAALDQDQNGMAVLRRGLDAWRGTGCNLTVAFCLVLLADAYARAKRPQEGLTAIEEAAHIIEATRERRAQAETSRLKGELLRLAGASDQDDSAELCFRAAIALAREQSAKLWELRAATSLARLWRDHGERAEARDLLAPIYAWFTEGFGEPDLKQAKALLDELT